MGNLSVSSLNATSTNGVGTISSSKNSESYEFFTTKTEPNKDGFVVKTNKKAVEQKPKEKTYKTDRGYDVTEKYQNGQLIYKKIELANHFVIEAEWNNGRLTVLDYHEPNKEFDGEANSYRYEFSNDGKYTLEYRNLNKKTLSKENGITSDEMKKDVLQESIYFLINNKYKWE